MASLANQTISSTYDGLIKTSTDQPVGISGVQLLEDGVGNSLALSVGRANQGVTITGTLTATSISGVLADGVTATTQTSGDNSTKVATTAYVDAQVTASDLDFAGDAGTGAVDLDSQSLTIAGTANEIETSASGQTITIGLPSSVTVGTLNATTLAGTLSTAAQTNITSVGTLSSLAVSGNLTVDTNTLFVDAANNRVGIGTSSLAVPLEINGTTRATRSGVSSQYIEFESTSSGNFITATGDTKTLTIGNSASNVQDIIFEQSGSEAMRIDSSGNVGINTSSPAGKLSVLLGETNLSTASAAATTGYPLSIRFTGTASDANLIRHEASANPTGYYTLMGTRYDNNKSFVINNKGSEIITYSDITSNGLGLSGGAGNLIRFDTAGSERMRIDSSGNVGIGTSNPDTIFHIESNGYSIIRLTDSDITVEDGSIAGKIEFENLDSSGGVNAYIAGINEGVLGDIRLEFATGAGGSPSERMRITGGGYLKASNTGTYAYPTASNHNFNSNAADVVLAITNSNANGDGIIVVIDGNNTTDYFFRGYSNNQGGENVFIYSNGNIVNRNNSYGPLSDIKLKENITDATPKLDKLMDVRIVNYNLIGDELNQIGVIAQELEQVFPALVDEHPDTKREEVVDEDGNVNIEDVDLGTTTKSVKMSVFVPILIKAMQEQQEIINDLKSRIETLENS